MRCISLISNGIDSPVASYVMSPHVNSMIFLHADIRPYTDHRMQENVKTLLTHLRSILNMSLKLYIIPHGPALEAYNAECQTRFNCVFCKRMFIRYANRIATDESADFIVMGDSLGQVASQTLQNIQVIDQISNIPILRPLIGFDKTDIVQYAKEIGTYQYSILKAQSCTAVPNKPATQATETVIMREEEKIDCDRLADKAVKGASIEYF